MEQISSIDTLRKTVIDNWNSFVVNLYKSAVDEDDFSKIDTEDNIKIVDDLFILSLPIKAKDRIIGICYLDN